MANSNPNSSHYDETVETPLRPKSGICHSLTSSRNRPTRMPSLKRLILYSTLITGYIISATLLTLFIYQQVAMQQQQTMLEKQKKINSNNNNGDVSSSYPSSYLRSSSDNKFRGTVSEATKDEQQPTLSITDEFSNSERNSYLDRETISSSLDWMQQLHEQHKPEVDSDYVTAYPVEKLELEFGDLETTTKIPSEYSSTNDGDDYFPIMEEEATVKPVIIISELTTTKEDTATTIELDTTTTNLTTIAQNSTSTNSAHVTLMTTDSPKGKTGLQTCETDECVLVASNMIRLLNRNANPCEDFYEFTCGHFGETLADQPPSSSATANRFPSQIEQTYKFLVEKTLERQTSQNYFLFPDQDIAKKQDVFLNKLRGFYASCMHQSSFTKYLMDLKKFLFGVGSIAARSTDLTRIVGELVLRDVFPLFGIAVHRPPLGDGHEIVDGRLAFTAPTRHLHPFALQPSTSASFVKIDSVVDLLADELSSAFGIERSLILQIDADMESSRLRNLYAATYIQANRDCERNIPIDEMPRLLGNFSHLFDWRDLVDLLVDEQKQHQENDTDMVTSVCVSNEFRRYLLSIEPVFANITKMELLFYSTFKAGQHLINYWTLFEEHGNSFSRRAECYKLIHDNFRDFLSEIIRNHLVRPFIEGEIENITAIIRRIAPNFSTINLSEKALREIKMVRSNLPEIRRFEELLEMNRQMPEMQGRSFLPNVLSAWKFKNQRELRKVGEKKIDIVKELDLILSLKAQAAFVPTMRQIRIYPLLLGLISPELGYSGETLPSSYIYGTLGFAIAHEFAHLLQFYQEQSVRRDSRLMATFQARETRRKDCLNDRNNEVLRNSFRAKSTSSPKSGSRDGSAMISDEERDYMSDASEGYLNELWADVLGLKFAFYAFQSALDDGGVDSPNLPGLLGNMTASQLFFVSFSQVFCSKTPPSNLMKRNAAQQLFAAVASSRHHFAQYSQNHLSHPPNYVRATLPLVLFRNEFAQAFNCPLSSSSLDAQFDDCS